MQLDLGLHDPLEEARQRHVSAVGAHIRSLQHCESLHAMTWQEASRKDRDCCSARHAAWLETCAAYKAFTVLQLKAAR